MATQNEATVAIRIRDETRAGFDSFQRSMGALEASFGRLRNVATAALGVLAGGLGLREMVNAAIEGEKSQARLRATLEATGYSAGLTEKQLEALNARLVGLTEFDDEAIRNAEAQLLKFGDIAGDNFERALKASTDLAAFLGTDLVTAAQQVGAAMSNQEGGIGRLERQFGALTKAEEDSIRAMQESGDVMGAQAAKLAVIESRIGGVAEAMNKGLAKSTSDASKAWRDLLEELGRSDGVIGGTLNRTLAGAASLLRDIRGEISGIRTPLSALLDDLAKLGSPAAALGKLGLEAARGPTNVAEGKVTLSPAESARRGEAARLAAEERARESKRLEDEKKRQQELEALRKKAEAEFLAREKRLTAEGIRAWADYADAVFETAERFVSTWNDAGQRVELPVEQFREMQAEADRMEREGLRGMLAAIEEMQRQSDALVYTWTAAGERVALSKDDWETLVEAGKSGVDVARELGLTFASAFEDAVSGGKSLRDVLKGIERDLIKLGTRKLVTEPFLEMFGKGMDAFKGGGFGGLMDFIGGLFNAKGNAFDAGRLVPFARGGIVDRPTLFPFARGVGLMGEAGPEAIMPLRRTASGDLGVAAAGGGITVNVSLAGGADRRSAQQIATEVGRAVARATRRNG